MNSWRRRITALLLGMAALPCAAQNGAHATQAKAFSQPGFRHEAQYDSLQQRDPAYQRTLSRKCLPRKVVYGWHPAWSGTAYTSYDFPLLHAVGYVGYEVDPASGRPLTLHQWRETALVERAHAGASTVELTATCHGSRQLATLLGRASSLLTLRDSLVSLIAERDADGICLDFEGLATAQSAAFTAWVTQLADTLHHMQPRRSLTLCLPAGDAGAAYDAKALAPLVDRFALRAYDFRGLSVQATGPVAPLEDVRAAVSSCLSRGIPAAKLLLGLPYFGYKWPTNGQDAGVPSTGAGEMVRLTRRAEAASDMDYLSDENSGLPYWVAKGGAAQVWVDDTTSLSAKLKLVDEFQLGGVAIWALGYDHGSDMYWDWLKAHLFDCSAETTASAERSTSAQEIPGSGVSSAERNEYNWLWMLGGGLVAIAIMLAVRKMMA
jgi:Glycosyl hydrolases family 18